MGFKKFTVIPNVAVNKLKQRVCDTNNTHCAPHDVSSVNALHSRCASIGVHSNVGYHGLTTLCACT